DVTCSLCLEQYQDPRVLACLHTYCRHCLESLVEHSQERTVSCPQCREKIFCITAHGRFLRTKQHKIIGVKEATVKGKSNCKSHYCPRHKGERLTLLCDTCDELICRDCA
ncbi:predicted protein, partial [Nematostella vectensis]